MPLAADEDLGAALDRVGHVALDLLHCLLVDQRADLTPVLEAVRDLRARAPPR